MVAPAMLTVKACAERIGVSEGVIYANLRSGRLRGFRVGTAAGRGTWRIDPGDFDLWLQSLRFADLTPPPPPPPTASSPVSPFSELDPARMAKAWARPPR